MLNRRKSGVLILDGAELREFKAETTYTTTASHLAFVQQAVLEQLLQHIGYSEGEGRSTNVPLEGADINPEAANWTEDNDANLPEVDEGNAVLPPTPSRGGSPRSAERLQYISLPPTPPVERQRSAGFPCPPSLGKADELPPTPGNAGRDLAEAASQFDNPYGLASDYGGATEDRRPIRPRRLMADVDGDELSRGIKSVVRFKW